MRRIVLALAMALTLMLGAANVAHAEVTAPSNNQAQTQQQTNDNSNNDEGDSGKIGLAGLLGLLGLAGLARRDRGDTRRDTGAVR